MSEDTERTDSPAAPPGSVPAHRTARQRRPTGAPPPLPHPFTISTTAWLVLAVVIVACAFLISAHTPWLGLGDRANTWCLRLLAEVRTPWLTDLARGIKAAGGGWGVTVVGLSVVALTMVFRRWRHLLVFLGALFDSQPTVGARFTGLRIYTFPGGCASYRFGFAPGASPLLIPAVDGLVAFVPRVRLVNYVRAKEGLALCGRGASCPG
jgi:hypothetical protein